jgi:hypothetical protein
MGCPPDRFRYAVPPPQPTLLLVVREPLRLKHYSLRTEHAHIGSTPASGAAKVASWPV